MNRTLKSIAAAVSLSCLLFSSAIARQRASDFTVQFSECVESIGVGLVPTALARVLVPADFVLVGEGFPVTPLVVRTARCGGIAVDGHKANPGVVAQIGFVIVPPDFTGDINNYTLSYYTTDALLAAKLRNLGIDAQHVQNVAYEVDAGAFHVGVPLPGHPTLALDGELGRLRLPGRSKRTGG